MQQFILAIIVISNVSVGFEVATDYEDAWAEFARLTTISDLQSGFAGGSDGHGEDTDCDHCCHGVAHFTGIVIDNFAVPFVRASSAIPLSDKANYFTSRSPPTPPPNV